MGGKQYQIRSTSVLIKKKKSFHFLCLLCYFPKLGYKLKPFDSKGGAYSTISYCFAQNLHGPSGGGWKYLCPVSPSGPSFPIRSLWHQPDGHDGPRALLSETPCLFALACGLPAATACSMRKSEGLSPPGVTLTNRARPSPPGLPETFLRLTLRGFLGSQLDLASVAEE